MLKKYRKFKLLLFVLLMILMAAGLQKSEALANTNHSVHEIMDLTGIMHDGNGSFIVHGHYVTRAQFAQMLVQASEYAGKVDLANRLQLFKDVSKSNKFSPYIQIAVTNSYMSGYLNGNFKPDKAVTAKEAVYGILTLLGYTNQDFSSQMSDARFDKFSELGLDRNLKFSNNKLTQSECETLFYNLLLTKQKSGDFYGKTLGYSFDSNNHIDYQALFSIKTKGPVITKDGWSKVLSKKLSDYTILYNNKKISASHIKADSIAYYAEQSGTIWIYSDKVCGIVQNITYNQGDPIDITISGTTYQFENTSNMKEQLLQSNIKKGSCAALLLGRNNLVSDIVSIKTIMANTGWEKKLGFTLAKGTIYLNNKRSAKEAIKNEDVIYYANELKTVWAFNQRIFGSLDNISVNDTEADTLNVAGTNYLVENSKLIKERIRQSSLKTGMPVVLLLGWDNKVYDLLALSSTVADNNWLSKLPFAPSQGMIYKGSSVISTEDIENYDVIYYSNELKTLWVYDKKVYGVLKTISPDSSSPDSIVVAGKTYNLSLPPINSASEGDSSADNLTENIWGDHLNKSGIKAGDNVVVLFGFNGNVADILPIEKMDVVITGYVLKAENQLIKNTTQTSSVKPVLSMVDTEGILREYPCSDTTLQSGMIVQVSFKDGLPVFKRFDSGYNITVPSDLTTRKFAADAHILEVKNTYYTSVSVSQMSTIKWSLSDVLYYRLNTSGEITDLMLNLASGSFYQYGLLKSTNYDDATGIVFNFSFGNTNSSLTTDNLPKDINLGPKAVLIVNGKIQEMHNLTEVPISYISNLQANTGDSVCWISDDATVYFYKAGQYYTGSLEDIPNFSSCTVKGYRDSDGPISIIIVTDR